MKLQKQKEKKPAKHLITCSYYPIVLHFLFGLVYQEDFTLHGVMTNLFI